MKNNSNRLAVKMLISMVAGILVGLIFMAIREHLGAGSAAWQTLNSWLFQDITAAGAEKAVGLFYIGGQLFVKALQLVIVPMVFTSIVLAIGTIRDAATLGRVSAKTFFWFLLTSACALLLAGFVGLICYNCLHRFDRREPAERAAERHAQQPGRHLQLQLQHPRADRRRRDRRPEPQREGL